MLKEVYIVKFDNNNNIYIFADEENAKNAITKVYTKSDDASKYHLFKIALDDDHTCNMMLKDFLFSKEVTNE